MATDNRDYQETAGAWPSDARRAAYEMSSTTRRIQGEFDEMPGLVLTEAQARRLWNLDVRTCRLVLTVLLKQRFLKRTANGMYARAA
jgi:hypothetical protein